MMDGEDVYRARLATCLAAAEAATLPQVRARHLAAARSWQTLLDGLLARKSDLPSADGDDGRWHAERKSVAISTEDVTKSMTPILIVTHAVGHPPHVFWASDAHVVAASTRLGDPDALGFEAAWDRYAAGYDRARWFASREEARLWADSHEGDDWLAIRAEIAKADAVPPDDLVFE